MSTTSLVPMGSRPHSVDLRALFHALNALWGVLAYHFLVPRVAAAATIGTLAVAWTVVEVLRLRDPALNRQVLVHPLFRRTIRLHEADRISGALWFLWGVAACLVLFPREAVEIGCLVMGFGDAAAQIVGKRFGRTRLAAGRTLEGSLAFVAASFLAVFAWRALLYAPMGLAPAALAAGVLALTGALVEAASVRVNDNLTVPVLGSAVAVLFV